MSITATPTNKTTEAPDRKYPADQRRNFKVLGPDQKGLKFVGTNFDDKGRVLGPKTNHERHRQFHSEMTKIHDEKRQAGVIKQEQEDALEAIKDVESLGTVSKRSVRNQGIQLSVELTHKDGSTSQPIFEYSRSKKGIESFKVSAGQKTDSFYNDARVFVDIEPQSLEKPLRDALHASLKGKNPLGVAKEYETSKLKTDVQKLRNALYASK